MQQNGNEPYDKNAFLGVGEDVGHIRRGHKKPRKIESPQKIQNRLIRELNPRNPENFLLQK